ncbi:hypothetical protein AGMMS49992_33040 [Clostridia bacterium]|nr:hypothetical protein AGMMS49992_33040 [Clostridia bacterium]
MAVIPFVWGQKQGVMPTLGTLDDAGNVTLEADVTEPLAAMSPVEFDIYIRKPGQLSYQAASGLVADENGIVQYVFTTQDLGTPGAVWITIRANAGSSYIDWTALAWVSQSVYAQHGGGSSALWVEALLAFANELNGVTASVTLTPPDEVPAATFGQGATGWHLALSLPDVRQISGGGEGGGSGSGGGHAIFTNVSSTAALLGLAAAIGDEAILADGNVYMCIGDAAQASGWARLTGDSNTGGEGDVTYIPPTVIPFSIQPGDWVSGSAQVSNAAFNAGSVGYINLPSGINADAYNAYAAAQIYVAQQINGSITLTALGTVPTSAMVLEAVLFTPGTE